MKILKTQTLRGPNYWSIRHHRLIIIRLDLETLAERPSNDIPGFYEGLIEVLPSLVEHFCSPGCRGGFLKRLQEGTMMGHIMEHVALELQTLAGMPVGFGRTRETATPGVYQVVFQYQHEQAGRYAARAAYRLCESIVATGHYSAEELEKDIKDLSEIREQNALGPSTEAIVQATLSSHSGILGVELACDKENTKRVLRNA
ncbi:MAG: cyanophycin synthetase, partial [Cyanobacteria bacterium J06626_14]